MNLIKNALGLFIFFILLTFPLLAQDLVLIEAESFENKGGWVLDQQFMDEMGSPFLLAHGLGNPVEGAVTNVTFTEVGRYRVWVRTRDWVAPWKTAETDSAKKAEGTPGIFQVRIDDIPLDTTFGTQRADWHWQDGGMVDITSTAIKLGLHDLTGFEGRCDAVLFSKDSTFLPPDRGTDLADFRRQALGLPDQPTDGGTYDLVVIGGGVAGTCAAVSAARLGLSVALIQDRPVLGGNNSSEIRVWLRGLTNYEPYPKIGDLVNEMDTYSDLVFDDAKKQRIVNAEDYIQLFLNFRANAVDVSANTIAAVIAQNTISGERLRFSGDYFADCTGDGSIGFLAGADFEMTQTGHMGHSNLWDVEDDDQPVSFPECPWALDLTEKPFPGKPGSGSGLSALGVWYWESGFDHDPILHREYIRDWNFRAMYGAWDCLKNSENRYPNYKISWAAYVAGGRESRRLLGDVILSEDDIKNKVIYDDGCVPCSWTIDLHYPNTKYESGFEGDAFISIAKHGYYNVPYWLPYRSLYSRNISNLFMAGRDISVTHEALGAVRVQRTTGMMGEVVGMAASLSKKYGTTPRGVYQDHLAELLDLMKEGIGKGMELPARTVAILDEADTTGVETNGTWQKSSHDKGYYGSNYIHDQNSGKGTKSIRFTPELPYSGLYKVYMRWTASSNRASNTPVQITHADGKDTVIVNQKISGATWVDLGNYNFANDGSANVLIYNKGTNGYVIVDAVCFADSQATAIQHNRDAAFADQYVLHYNYPNPFNPSTTIVFSLAKTSSIELTVHDILGRPVRHLVNGRMEGGTFQLHFDGKDDHGRRLASGLYLYTLKSGGYKTSKKMILLY